MKNEYLTPRLPHWVRRLVLKRYQVTLDALLIVCAFLLSYWIRFEFDPHPEVVSRCFAQMPYVVLIQLSALSLAGVYSLTWRYVSMTDLPVFIRASSLSLLTLLSLRMLVPSEYVLGKLPFSVIAMDTALGFGTLVGARVLRRLYFERYERSRGGSVSVRKRVLLIGAGHTGLRLASEIRRFGRTDLEVKGFVDDEPSAQGAVIQGVRVVGTTSDLPVLVAEHRIDHVLVGLERPSPEELRYIVALCADAHVRVRIIENLADVLVGQVGVRQLRDVRIEDLLGREAVRLDESRVAGFLAGKRVMITGAGGSIGAELARQVARHHPSRLFLVERAEPALFAIHHELTQFRPELDVTPLLADIADVARMRQVFARCIPHVVLHAAAHKHVPMMETNVCEAVHNNVLATRQLGELAAKLGTDVFVLISTDKAVRPSSVIGATKRLAELTVQELQSRFDTRFVSVRFGNVIGSAGSAIPIFQKQIKEGGPITLTHEDMVRFFMTIPEAAALVLRASSLGQGGKVFVLDMGAPVRIVDVAEALITLSGLKPYDDIAIVFTGIRPGEKLSEELAGGNEVLERTDEPKIFIANSGTASEGIMTNAIERLKVIYEQGDDDAMRDVLRELVPDADLGAPTPDAKLRKSAKAGRL